MRYALILAAVLVLAAATSVLDAHARGPGYGRGMGNGYGYGPCSSQQYDGSGQTGQAWGRGPGYCWNTSDATQYGQPRRGYGWRQGAGPAWQNPAVQGGQPAPSDSNR